MRAADWSEVKGLQILNSEGKVFYNAGKYPSQDINAKALRPGLYLIKLTLENGAETTRKVAIGQLHGGATYLVARYDDNMEVKRHQIKKAT